MRALQGDQQAQAILRSLQATVFNRCCPRPPEFSCPRPPENPCNGDR